MSTAKQSLLLLFDSPNEPVLTKRGDDVAFDLPNRFLTDRYKPIGTEISSRFDDTVRERIRVKDITPPNMKSIEALRRDENFSLWIPRHAKLAGQMIDIFMGEWSLFIELKLIKITKRFDVLSKRHA